MSDRRRMALTAFAAVLVGGALYGLLHYLDSRRPEPPRQVFERRVPDRIVSLSPALTEILFALGGGDLVVGVTDFCAYPPEVADLPRCGGFLNPNLERLTELHPDLIVIQGIHDLVRDHAEAHGMRYSAQRLDSLADLHLVINDLGAQLGRHNSSMELNNRIDRQLDAVRAAVAELPRRRVLLSTDRAAGSLGNLITCGRGSFLDSLIDIAGGENVFGRLDEFYPQPSLEAVTEAAPEVILDLQPDKDLSAADLAKLKSDWTALPTLPAVRDGRIEVITESYVLVPCPRVGLSAKRLAEAIHPGVSIELPD